MEKSFFNFLKSPMVREHSFWVGKRNLDYWEVYHSKYSLNDIHLGKTPIHLGRPIKTKSVQEYELIVKNKRNKKD